jgi:hypothetical protein
MTTDLDVRLNGSRLGVDVDRMLSDLERHLNTDAETNIGFSSTLDLDYGRLFPFFNKVLNNVGDPFVDSAYRRNTKHLEVQVLEWFAALLRAPQQWWGVTTSGGTEGIEYGLVHARHRYPDGIALHSSSAHYSAQKVARHLRLPTIALRSDQRGVLDLADLRDTIRAHRHRPLIRHRHDRHHHDGRVRRRGRHPRGAGRLRRHPGMDTRRRRPLGPSVGSSAAGQQARLRPGRRRRLHIH